MSEAGYTLTETLTALAVIGLAIGGFSLGVQVLGAQQSAVGATVVRLQDVRAAHLRLERLMADGAPFRSHDAGRFSGEAGAFRFECGAPVRCEARLAGDQLLVSAGSGDRARFRLPYSGPARFIYRGADSVSDAWPPTGPRQALRSVSLVQGEAGSEVPVLTARVWIEQPARCAYDSVLGDCA